MAARRQKGRFPSEVPAGGSVALNLTVDPPGIGERVVAVRLETSEEHRPGPSARLVLKGEPLQVPYVIGEVAAIDLIGAELGPVSRETTIRTVEAKSASRWIEGIAAREPWVRVTELESTTQPGPSPDSVERLYRFTISAELNSDVDGRGTYLEVRTDGTEKSPLPKVRLTARLVPAVRAAPQSLYLSVSRSSFAPEQRTIVLSKHDRDLALECKVFPPSSGWLRVNEPEVDHRADIQRLQVVVFDLPKEPADGIAKSEIQIQTNHPATPVVTIPIFLQIKP